MGARKLTANVYVDGVLHEADSTPPAEVAKQITNPKAWGGDAPADESDAPKYPEGEPSEDWTHDQLDAYAADKSVDLTGAKNKADKVAAAKASASA